MVFSALCRSRTNARLNTLRVRGLPGGFTLVELLVVIAIIGTLVGLLLPAVQAAREAGNRLACTNNLKQLGLAVTLYHDAKKTFPSGRNTRDPYGVSWAFRMLPFMEQINVYNAYVPAKRCDDTANSAAMRTPVSTFFCASRRSPVNDRNFDNNNEPPLVLASAAGGDYSAVAGTYFLYAPADNGSIDPKQAGPIHTFSAVRSQQVTDGLSRTFAIGDRHIPKADTSVRADMQQFEQGDTSMFCADTPQTLFRDTARGLAISTDDLNYRKFGSLHTGLTNFVFLDAHVDSIDANTDLTVLRWYSTIGDGNDPTAPPDGANSGT